MITIACRFARVRKHYYSREKNDHSYTEEPPWSRLWILAKRLDRSIRDETWQALSGSLGQVDNRLPINRTSLVWRSTRRGRGICMWVSCQVSAPVSTSGALSLSLFFSQPPHTTTSMWPGRLRSVRRWSLPDDNWWPVSCHQSSNKIWILRIKLQIWK